MKGGKKKRKLEENEMKKKRKRMKWRYAIRRQKETKKDGKKLLGRNFKKRKVVRSEDEKDGYIT